ncbi:hypothetical protein D9Q98_003193 [Chlorella vulgaris]|uniref:GH16 domain-containing protein n=1 Tax=Chlorella vulgaris TaxID=3077 RepID=A0A9D4TSD9_CHLVU|nr:hypothetical protein D9Q98_003193 [Chlorella vulgaris]
MALPTRRNILLLGSLFLLQVSMLLRPVDADCRAQLLQASPGNAGMEGWVDADTPEDSCTRLLPSFAAAYQLVFSDEFNTPDRDFRAAAQDPKWTAQNLYYSATNDVEVYKPEQVTVDGGAAVLTIERLPDGETATAPVQQASGEIQDVSKQFKSGMLQGWSKFCYTGGYVEASIQLPGNELASGLWPAFWAMGNLGRAGYLASTAGVWPYSYNTCEGSGPLPWSSLDGQLITACPGDPPGVNRAAWGLHPEQGRGGPEFDVFEVVTAVGGAAPPHTSQTLQMAPVMPPGTDWGTGPAAGGVAYPGAGSSFNTRRNSWQGSLGRPGNEYQDSISALSDLGPSFYTDQHTYGVDWRPGQYLRWYIDGQLLYEVNQQALVAQTNASGAAVGPRLIPMEPMYLILNLAMSPDFGEIEYERLTFPSQMKVDWIRVYQPVDQINVGCSPPEFPTAQYVACNRKKFIVSEEEEGMLITDVCGTPVSNAAATAAPSSLLLMKVAMLAAALAAALQML